MFIKQTSVAAAMLFVFAAAGWLEAQDDKAKNQEKIEVRRLPSPKGLPFTVGGGKSVQVLDSVQALEKLAGAKAGAELARSVDFTRERVLFVSWGTSGPPFGTLEFAVKMEDKSAVVEFHIKEPKTDRRGQAFRVGADFFAVPKGVTGRFQGAKGKK